MAQPVSTMLEHHPSMCPSNAHAMPQAMHVRTYVQTYNYSPTELTHAGKRAQGGSNDLSIDRGISRLGDELASLVPVLSANPQRHQITRSRAEHNRAPIPHKDRVFVYQRDNFRCVQCSASYPLTLDHIVPWSAGGSDDVDNLRTLCWPCNHHRSNFQRVDDAWKPLPRTYWCIDCCGGFPLNHPSLGPAFCWWCRHAALGSRPSWFITNNAAWDYSLNWHRELSGVTR